MSRYRHRHLEVPSLDYHNFCLCKWGVFEDRWRLSSSLVSSGHPPPMDLLEAHLHLAMVTWRLSWCAWVSNLSECRSSSSDDSATHYSLGIALTWAFGAPWGHLSRCSRWLAYCRYSCRSAFPFTASSARLSSWYCLWHLSRLEDIVLWPLLLLAYIFKQHRARMSS